MGPGPMLEGVRALCSRLEVPAQLALEAPMACGFGACFGCVVPARDGRYLRVCVDGPVIDARGARPRGRVRRSARVSVDFCGLELAHPIVNGSGTFDAVAAARGLRRGPAGGLPVRRLRLQDDHAGPPRGQPAAADLGGAGRDDQLDRPAQQGPGRHISTYDLPRLAGITTRGHDPGGELRDVPLYYERDGLDRRRAARAGGGVRAARGDRGHRAERVLPERADGARHRRRPRPAAGRASASCATPPPSR